MGTKRKLNDGGGTRHPEKTKIAKTDNSTARQADVEVSRLLALPAELRIKVYEHALVKPHDIQVTASLLHPSLLQVNRQQETQPIWCQQNEFYCYVRDCDATCVLRFRQNAVGPDYSLKLIVDLKGMPNWANLLRWCEDIARNRGQARQTVVLEREENDGPLVGVVTSAHEIAEKMGSSSGCAEVLDCLRSAVGKYERKWLE